VDEDAFQGMSREQIVDEYVRYNGVLFVRLKQGQNIQNIVHHITDVRLLPEITNY